MERLFEKAFNPEELIAKLFDIEGLIKQFLPLKIEIIMFEKDGALWIKLSKEKITKPKETKETKKNEHPHRKTT